MSLLLVERMSYCPDYLVGLELLQRSMDPRTIIEDVLCCFLLHFTLSAPSIYSTSDLFSLVYEVCLVTNSEMTELLLSVSIITQTKAKLRLQFIVLVLHLQRKKKKESN